MARRRSAGEYILSFLGGAIPSLAQSSQMHSAMNSKAALEAQKQKKKITDDEIKRTEGLQDKEIAHLYKQAEAGNQSAVDTLRTKFKLGAVKGIDKNAPRVLGEVSGEAVESRVEGGLSDAPAEFNNVLLENQKKFFDAELARKKVEDFGKSKSKSGSKSGSKGGSSVDRKNKELNTLYDDFKALEQFKQSGNKDEALLAKLFGQEAIGKDVGQLEAMMKRRVEDFDSKWGDNLMSLIYQPTPESPPDDALIGGGEEERQKAIDFIKAEKGDDFKFTEEDIAFVIKNNLLE